MHYNEISKNLQLRLYSFQFLYGSREHSIIQMLAVHGGGFAILLFAFEFIRMLQEISRYSARCDSERNAQIAMRAYKACLSTRSAHIHVYAYLFNTKYLHLCFEALVSSFVQYFS